MDIFIGVVVGLLVLMFLVTAHEFGHFLAARRNGVRVLEFGIGFPPRAVAWIKDPKTGKWRKLKRSEWQKGKVTKTVGVDDKNTKTDTGTTSKKLFEKGMIFSLNWLPIGGFCQMDGESDADTRKGTFGMASYWAKTKILFAGVAMNWLVAFIIFTILAWAGMPTFLEGQFTIESDTRISATPVQVTSVAEESPAAKAGIEKGDYILSVNGTEVTNGDEIRNFNSEHAGKEVTYKIRREIDCNKNPSEGKCPQLGKPANGGSNTDTIEQTFTVTLNEAEAEYLLGVTMASTQAVSYSTWSAPIVGAGLTLQLTGETFKGVGIMIGNLVSGTARLFSPDDATRESGQEALSEVKDSVSGPIGIIGVLFPAFTSAGPANLAFLAALISVSLACMNVLPIPALDGGRWLLITIYKLRKKKLTKETEEKIVSRAFIVLLGLIFIVTILDIIRIAS
ncbi:site-2 protease family protein [Candidatus Saccharibacteria bacterium]|nr:site-2 protease family protein [Candidatus Saccharibacteria bacterium]